MPLCSLLLHLSMHSSLPTEVSVQRTEYTVSLLPEGFFTERVGRDTQKGSGWAREVSADRSIQQIWGSVGRGSSIPE